MLVSFVLLLLAFCLVLFLKILSLLISESSLILREELSSYECGFEHHNLSRVPFSLRYFFLTLIFLLFDLEIILIVFIPSSLYSVRVVYSVSILSLFLVLLLLGLFYEWKDGRLEWVS
jgi:NADH-ubiquinone oxidoreductase chain 3